MPMIILTKNRTFQTTQTVLWDLVSKKHFSTTMRISTRFTVKIQMFPRNFSTRHRLTRIVIAIFEIN